MIVRNNLISFGQPTLDGTRLTMFDIVSGIKSETLSEYLNDHELNMGQAKEVLDYCMNLKCQNTEGRFCNGCILATVNQPGKITQNHQIEKIAEDIYLVDSETGSIFLGSRKDYDNLMFGDIGWGIAREVYETYFQHSV